MSARARWGFYSLGGWLLVYLGAAVLCLWIENRPLAFFVAFMAGVIAGAWYDFCADRKRERLFDEAYQASLRG